MSVLLGMFRRCVRARRHEVWRRTTARATEQRSFRTTTCPSSSAAAKAAKAAAATSPIRARMELVCSLRSEARRPLAARFSRPNLKS